MADQTAVHWREWGKAAFDEAKAQDKPILLGISAVWCHWCHVMDRGVPGDPVHTGVYSDPQIAAYINQHFIPIRVDNDQRPDVNARYNMGGWPTTCFLTPDGDVIYGATYLAPAQMRQLLPRVVEVWRNDRDEILKQLREHADRRDAADLTPPTSDDGYMGEVVRTVLNAVVRAYDPRNSGLGNGQKFPMSDAWALLLALHAQTGEARLLDMVVQTLTAMGTRGMYDRVAGGWFRYSTTPDWSVPHFEKMLEDHARLLPVYAQAIQVCQRLGRTADAETLQGVVDSALDYLLSTLLRDTPTLTYFAGSQDADEEYYSLSRLERAARPAPFIDWRLYADWNALMVSALLQVAALCNRPTLVPLAVRLWRTLVQHCLDEDAAVIHSLIPSGDALQPSSVRGLLADQAALAKASLDLAQHRPELKHEALEVADAALGFVLSELQGNNGAFDDAPTQPNSLGMLRVRIQPIFDNATVAEAMLTLGYLRDQPVLRERAGAVLRVFAEEYRRYRDHGSPYALAVFRTSQLPEEVVLIGRAGEVDPLVAAAQATYVPWRVVHLADPERDADFIARRGYPVAQLPVAFICRGTTCSAPVYAPEQLGAALADANQKNA